MKKAFIVVLVFLGIVLLASLTQAQEPEKVSTLVLLKTNWFDPKIGEQCWRYDANMYFNYKFLGAGLEVETSPENDAITIRPMLQLVKKPWYLNFGSSTNSQGRDYLFGGFWYINSFKGFSVLADVRNYIGYKGENSTDYLDSFLKLKYLFQSQVFIGTEMNYDHWWGNDSHNYFLVGPIFGYKFNKNVSIYIRPSREWEGIEGQTSVQKDRIRLGLEMFF